VTVGILVVSHSAAIATGTVELARQMAADVPLVAAGGTDDGGIGTSFEAITAGIEELAQADAVVVLCDLGSAYLTTDTALDFLDDDVRARVHVSQAPLVEGAVAAAVAAPTGGDPRPTRCWPPQRRPRVPRRTRAPPPVRPVTSLEARGRPTGLPPSTTRPAPTASARRSSW
jgi:dihydroxyacetone kinase phosphotransfer subunit